MGIKTEPGKFAAEIRITECRRPEIVNPGVAIAEQFTLRAGDGTAYESARNRDEIGSNRRHGTAVKQNAGRRAGFQFGLEIQQRAEHAKHHAHRRFVAGAGVGRRALCRSITAKDREHVARHGRLRQPFLGG